MAEELSNVDHMTVREDFDGIIDNQSIIDHPRIRYLVVDFGKKPVNGEYVKKFPLEDLENTETICYKIVKDPDIKDIYRFFQFNKYEGVVKPGENVKLKITYNPIIPHRKDIENFEFIDSSFNIIKIRVIGESIGPTLKVSIRQLRFTLTPSDQFSKRNIELKNVSEVPAEFCFENDDDIFCVEPKQGTVPGNTYSYIAITFAPTEYGYYSQQLYGLIWGGAPIVVELRGIYRKTKCGSDYPEITNYNFSNNTGYLSYMQDCPKSTYFQPVSVSRSYLDFGRASVSNEDRNADFFAVTNNLDNDISVRWPKDDIFNVVPKKVNISKDESVPFKCYFAPNENNKFFCKTMIGQVRWTPNKGPSGPVYPIPAAIRFQGHSFPEDQCWIPNVEVYPRIITLPTCLPDYPSFTNFKITALSHLPVMYKLIPPKKTHFTLKPMVGVIRNYGIVVIQLAPAPFEDKEFKEVWYLQLNDREDRQIPICIRAEVSKPKILVGENNVVNFDPVLPGCQAIIDVVVKNISGYKIKYDFGQLPYECIGIDPQEGILSSNEETYVKFCYTGTADNPKKMYLKCTLQRFHQTEQIGIQYTQTIAVCASCRYTELCSTPTYYDFGEVELNTPLETDFYLFNFGHWNVNYLLNVSCENGSLDSFKAKPRYGDIGPSNKKKIHIFGEAKSLGRRTITVTYCVRTHGGTRETTAEGSSIKVFEIYYTSTMPIIQIEDVVEHTFGQLFSKEHFWEYLQVDQLNEHLGSITTGETRKILLYLPEAEVGDKECYVTLAIENKSKHELDVQLKRIKECDCTVKEVALNINTTEKKFDCPHREMLSMKLSSNVFCPNTLQLLTIKVKYLIAEETKMTYLMQLPQDRNLEISFLVYSIPPNTMKLSWYQSDLVIRLKDISISRRVAPIQTFWFYNNTNQSATYSVNEENILSLCKSEDFEIMKCINPKGVIEAYRTFPLLIRFQPIEVKEYIVHISLTYNTDNHIDQITIMGSGHREFAKYELVNRIPAISTKCGNYPVTFSHEYLSIDCLSVWNTVKRIIFMNNTSRDKIFQYFWEEVGIENIVEISVENKLGMLKPQESRAVVVTIKTFNESCISSLLLPCYLVDYTQLILHQKCIAAAEKHLRETERRMSLGDEDVSDKEHVLKPVPHPDPFIKSVIINFQIIHSRDHHILPIEDQFKTNPSDRININISNLMQPHNEIQNERVNITVLDKEKMDLGTIMEQLIGQFVFSNTLEEILEHSNKLPSPVYKQFTLDERKIIEKKKNSTPLSNSDLSSFRKKEIRKLFTRPQSTLISNVVRDLIIHGIHDTLKLGAFDPLEYEENETCPVVTCPADCQCQNLDLINSDNPTNNS